MSGKSEAGSTYSNASTVHQIYREPEKVMVTTLNDARPAELESLVAMYRKWESRNSQSKHPVEFASWVDNYDAVNKCMSRLRYLKGRSDKEINDIKKLGCQLNEELEVRKIELGKKFNEKLEAKKKELDEQFNARVDVIQNVCNVNL